LAGTPALTDLDEKNGRTLSGYLHDPLLVITAGIVVIGYLIFAGFVVRQLLASRVAHPGRFLAAVTTLLAGLPAVLYGLAAVVV